MPGLTLQALRLSFAPAWYTRILNFMGGYAGRKRGGHLSRSPAMPVIRVIASLFLIPSLKCSAMNTRARLRPTRMIPGCSVIFQTTNCLSDLRLLSNYLALPEKDAGHQAALAWLRARHKAIRPLPRTARRKISGTSLSLPWSAIFASPPKRSGNTIPTISAWVRVFMVPTFPTRRFSRRRAATRCYFGKLVS